MPTNNDHIPTVRYSMENNWSNSIHRLMQTFISAGSKKGVARLQQLNKQWLRYKFQRSDS